MAIKRDIGSLVGIPISRHGGWLEGDGKQSDLTPLLLLAPDVAPVAELAPEIARSPYGLVADLAPVPAPGGHRLLSLCARRVRRFILG